MRPAFSRITVRIDSPIEPRCTGRCGALAINWPWASNSAGEIQALLDVDRVGGILQPQAHLLGDRHEQVVEHFEHHRIDTGADGGAVRARLDAREHQVIERRHIRLPAGLNHGRGVGFRDDRRALRWCHPAAGRRGGRPACAAMCRRHACRRCPPLAAGHGGAAPAA